MLCTCVDGATQHSAGLCHRFPDLQVGFVSNCSAACVLAEQAGCDLLASSHDSGNILGFCGRDPQEQWPSAKSMAQSLLTTLGKHCTTSTLLPVFSHGRLGLPAVYSQWKPLHSLRLRSSYHILQ